MENQQEQQQHQPKLLDDLPTFVANDQTKYDLDLADLTTFKVDVGGNHHDQQQQQQPTKQTEVAKADAAPAPPEPSETSVLDMANPDLFVIGQPIQSELHAPVTAKDSSIITTTTNGDAADAELSAITSTTTNGDDWSTFETHSQPTITAAELQFAKSTSSSLANESLANITCVENTSCIDSLLSDLPEETFVEDDNIGSGNNKSQNNDKSDLNWSSSDYKEEVVTAPSVVAFEPSKPEAVVLPPPTKEEDSLPSPSPPPSPQPMSADILTGNGDQVASTVVPDVVNTNTTTATTTTTMGRKNQSYRRENSNDEAESSGPVAELVYWRDVKNSGVVFGAGLVILFSLSIFSVISVVAYTLLFTLLGTLSFRIYKNVMQAVNKTNEGHPFKEYLEIEIAPPQERIHEIVDSVVAHGTCFINRMRSVLLVEDLVDSLKYLLIFWALTYIGACFNGLTLILLAYLGAFSLPIVYEQNKAQIDQYLDLVSSKISEISDKVPFLKKVPTEKKEDEIIQRIFGSKMSSIFSSSKQLALLIGLGASFAIAAGSLYYLMTSSPSTSKGTEYVFKKKKPLGLETDEAGNEVEQPVIKSVPLLHINHDHDQPLIPETVNSYYKYVQFEGYRDDVLKAIMLIVDQDCKRNLPIQAFPDDDDDSE
ncbi:Reticulon-like protein, partial [Tyrophagus putrescentiae]